MGWRDLFGGKPKPKPKKSVAKLSPPAVKDSARAKLIAEALAVHRTQSANVRETLKRAIGELERGGAKTLRDPEALQRLMSLIHAQRTMKRLMSGDLRRYLVLNGVRELVGKAAETVKTKIVRR